MKFLDKLDMLMSRRSLNRHTLAQQCGLPYTTIIGLYERGLENARVSTIDKLAGFFGVPLDYLAYDEYDEPEDFHPNGRRVDMPIAIETPDEAALLTAYRSLNKASQSVALAMLQGLAGNPDAQKGPLPGATGTSYI